MSIQDFTNTFTDCITPGNKVLDLGAGDCMFTQMFLERGAIVTAVDTRPPAFHDDNLTFKKMTVEDFCAAEKKDRYNFIFARNIIQFLDKHWVFETLFPWMDEHVAEQGVVAITTFYQDPKPPFDKLMRSLYTLNELTSYFMTWKELYAKEFSDLGSDMRGQTRKFFISSLIIQKPN